MPSAAKLWLREFSKPHGACTSALQSSRANMTGVETGTPGRVVMQVAKLSLFSISTLMLMQGYFLCKKRSHDSCQQAVVNKGSPTLHANAQCVCDADSS